jgi:uncharacterized protein with HEPN domain
MQKEEINKIRIIYEALSKIIEFTEGMKSVDDLISNTLVIDAVKMNLIVIYETDLKLDDETKKIYNNIEWHKIQEYKSHVMSMYMGFNSNLIWKLICEEIPEYKKKIEEILQD